VDSFTKERHYYRNIFPGKYITIQFDNYQWIEGEIKEIRNDSVFINQKVSRIVGNGWGLPVRDTVSLGLLAYAINQIYAMPLKISSWAL